MKLEAPMLYCNFGQDREDCNFFKSVCPSFQEPGQCGLASIKSTEVHRVVVFSRATTLKCKKHTVVLYR